MLLLDIRDRVKSAGRIAVHDLSIDLKISPEDARSMLDHWVIKGCVRKLPSGSLCKGSCRSCAPNTIELYEWIPSL